VANRLLVLFASLLISVSAWSQTLGSIRGTIVDASGAAVPGAQITLTESSTHAAVRATTDANGEFQITNVAPGTYSLLVNQTDFDMYRQSNIQIQPGQTVSLSIKMSLRPVSQTVEVHGDITPGVNVMPSEQEVFASDEQIRVLDRKQIDTLGPIAGAAQMVSLAPGANVTGYGNSGATKYTVSLNGISQGWGGYGGYTGGASLNITFDGFPIVDPATDLWQSATLPQTQLIQNVNVVYGPGDPIDRWYANVGGSIEFTPLQPTGQFHGDVWATYGSYNQRNLAFDLASSVYNGWSAIVAAGGNLGDDFRSGPDGFNNPSKDYAVYSKALKTFEDSSFDLGGYFAHSGGYRAQVIPMTPNPLITMNGLPGGVIYSQATSGFYSSLPYDSYNKYDTNEMGNINGRFNIKLDDSTRIEDQAWYMYIRRLHDRLNDVYNLGPQVDEWNNPHTYTVGNQVDVTKSLSGNLINAGAYFIHTMYNSRNNFYDPLLGGSYDTVNIGGKIRSSYFNQDDFAIALQDDFHPYSKLHITPGIRYVGFDVGYSQAPLEDFHFAPGVILSQYCPSTQLFVPGNTKNQGAICDNHQNRSGFEPSVNASYYMLPWLTLYGGLMEALRAPELGGGGGLFQSVDPNSYHLARQIYEQGGFKIHTEGSGPLRTMILGAAFYHENYKYQEIDIPLSNGDVISANGSSVYHGLNVFFDDDPISSVHVFANLNFEKANYSNYVVSGLPYNGSPVPYVPAQTFNAGFYYSFKAFHRLTLDPAGEFQFIGAQHVFDNTVGAPSNQTMAAYGTMNLSLKIPFKHFELTFAGLNVLNNEYNIYEFISSGGYFGTPTGGYMLAYPGAPFTAYGGVNFHF
jgi:iron complex outermembrane receptor protein